MKNIKLHIVREHSPPKFLITLLQIKYTFMKTIFLTLFLLFSVLTNFAQLDKGTWLVGGNGSYNSTKVTDREPFTYNNGTGKELILSPNVGYFVIDKLCFGLKPSFRKYKGTFIGGNPNAHWFDIGPFGRYYFLDKEKQFNILTELSTQFGVFNDLGVKTSTSTILSAMGGIEAFFNSSCGVELLMGYQNNREKFDNGIKRKQGFQMKIGFQLHLTK
jgi:hypothetical protein